MHIGFFVVFMSCRRIPNHGKAVSVTQLYVDETVALAISTFPLSNAPRMSGETNSSELDHPRDLGRLNIPD